MTPKEKAKELIDKYTKYSHGGINETVFKSYSEKYGEINGEGKLYFFEVYKYSKTFYAKESAIIAVDEILIIMQEEYLEGADKIDYWQQVKKEINSF